MRFDRGIVIMVCLVGFNLPLLSQDFTHPRDMRLPNPGFQPPDPDRYRLELDSGLTVYIVPDRSSPIVNLSAFVAFGTADDHKQGAAEVLLKGLREGPAAAKDFQADLYNLGAEFRVEMSAEETEIHLSVGSEDVAKGLEMLSGILRTPAVGDPKKHPAVQLPSEASMDKARAVFRDQVLGRHPYGYRPTADDFAKLNREDLANLRKRVLIPSRTVLAISGDFDQNSMRDRLQDVFSGWEAAESEGRASFDPIKPATGRRLATVEAEKLQGWIVLGHELPRVPNEDWAALEVMNYILGGGHFDTRLFRVTRDQRGLTNDDSGFLEPSVRGPGLYSFRTYGRPEVVRLLIELTLQEIDRIRQEFVNEEELFVARGALADGNYAMLYEDAYATARSFAIEWMRYGDHARSESYPQRIRAVTAQDVRSAAQKYLHPERFQIVVVGPIGRIQDAPQVETERQLEDYGQAGSN